MRSFVLHLCHAQLSSHPISQGCQTLSSSVPDWTDWTLPWPATIFNSIWFSLIRFHNIWYSLLSLNCVKSTFTSGQNSTHLFLNISITTCEHLQLNPCCGTSSQLNVMHFTSLHSDRIRTKKRMSWQVGFTLLSHCDAGPDVSLSAVVCRWCHRRSAWWTSPATAWKQCLNISSTARMSRTSTSVTTSWAFRDPGAFSTSLGNVDIPLVRCVSQAVKLLYYWWNRFDYARDRSILTPFYSLQGPDCLCAQFWVCLMEMDFSSVHHYLA